MRTLSPPPDSVLDPDGRRPRTGSYRGPLPPVDLGPLGHGPLFRLARHKRWLWGTLISDELLLGFAAVDLGYAANAFAFALDRTAKRLLADRSVLGAPFCVRIGERTEEGCEARFERGRELVRVTRPVGSPAYEVEVALGALRIEARLDTTAAPPPLSAVVELAPNGVGTTQKRTLLAGSGGGSIGDRPFSLDGALGGLDYSNGYPPRHTVWKWCFLLGRALSGERIGLNLVEGFVGEPECAVWIGDELHPLAEGRFELDRKDPLAPWRIRTADAAVQLEFEPAGAHRERTNLGLIASHFVQVAGHFRGTVAPPGRAPLELDGVPGVAEDQDMLW